VAAAGFGPRPARLCIGQRNDGVPMMRAKPTTALAVLVSLMPVSLMLGGHAVSANMSPVGLWQAVDPDTRQPTGWFAITEHDGIYDGTLVKMFLQPGQNPNVVCDKCRDDRHNQPWLGLQIIRGMKADRDNKYVGGSILDPRNGDVYDAMMSLTPDGQTLVVRGYLGFSLLGRNEYWTRLPDSDYAMLDPSIRNTLDQATKSDPPVGRAPR
jgi:uncharacterized protein (DUF2147 family)